MADYIYLLETRLSAAQQRAIGAIRNIARENEVTVFLTGGAVRDLTGGGSVRDLDLTIQGDALKLKRPLENAGAVVVGEHSAAQQLFLQFPGGVRVELASAVCVTYPKPGKPKYEPGSITDDLRRRDFTANAMAISLNEGSYGLLMDPLNGVADIENRELRLVSNYGFIEDPSRLIRAARLMSRLGWQMEEKTRARYETAKEEKYIENLSAWNRGYELEEIFHEEDPVRILRALETEGWMAHLFPALASGKANMAALAELSEKQGQLQMQGILAQPAAIAFPLVTAKMSPSDLAALKKTFVRPGFVSELESLDARTREFANRISGKDAASPSAAWRLLHQSEPNLVLALSYASKGAAVQNRLKTFLTESPTARQRIPYAMMQEMRITSDLPEFDALIDRLFFELMDGRLSTPEEMKAFLEPYSPPAPPPPVNLRRARAKKEARPSRAKGKKAAEVAPGLSVAAEEEATGVAEGLMETGDLTGPDRGPEPTPKPAPAEKVAPAPVKKALAKNLEAAAAQAKSVPVKAPAAAKPAGKKTAPAPAKASKSAAKSAPPAKSVGAKKTMPVKAKLASVKKSVPVKAAKTIAPKKAVVKKSAPAKAVAKKSALKTVAKKAAPVKSAAKKSVPSTKASAKKSAPAKKSVPAKKAPPTKSAAKNSGAKKSAAKKGTGRR